jgi:hypothetical protein
MHVAPRSLAHSARPCGMAMSFSNWVTQDQTTEGYEANRGDQQAGTIADSPIAVAYFEKETRHGASQGISGSIHSGG